MNDYLPSRWNTRRRERLLNLADLRTPKHGPEAADTFDSLTGGALGEEPGLPETTQEPSPGDAKM